MLIGEFSNSILSPKWVWRGCGEGGGGGGVLPIIDYTAEGTLPGRGTFFRLEVYKRIGILRAEVEK